MCVCVCMQPYEGMCELRWGRPHLPHVRSKWSGKAHGGCDGLDSSSRQLKKKGVQGRGDSFSSVALTFPVPWAQQAEQPGSISMAPGSVPPSSPHLSPKELLPSPGTAGVCFASEASFLGKLKPQQVPRPPRVNLSSPPCSSTAGPASEALDFLLC